MHSSLAFFLYIHPLEFYIMNELLPDFMAWTEGIDGHKDKYLNVVEKVRMSTEGLYAAQKDFLNTLMINTDGGPDSPSSRKLFLSKIRRYVIDLSMEQRVSYNHFHCKKSSILFIFKFYCSPFTHSSLCSQAYNILWMHQ